MNVKHHSLASMAMSDTATLKLRDRNQSALTTTAEEVGLNLASADAGEGVPVDWLLFAITSRVWEI
jgi:hypothetical protein